MVFCETKRNADFIGYNLRRYHFDALTLHGGLNQNKRNRVLEEFHKSEKFILVCTDVAARGLDIKNVSHIYNYDCPKNNIEYIHRIGRTARAGKEGKAITILAPRDHDNFRRVLNDDSLSIKKIPLPEFVQILVNMIEKHFKPKKTFNQKRFSEHNRDFRDERKSNVEWKHKKKIHKKFVGEKLRKFERMSNTMSFHKR